MITDINQLFYSHILPEMDRILKLPDINYIDQINAVLFKNIVLYGPIGSGKTELVRAITEKTIKKYGENNVNAIKADNGELLSLIDFGLDDKLIQLLFCDDISIRRIDPLILAEYFRIRHTWKSATKRNYGFILGIVSTHRFHNTPPALRSNFNALIIKRAPDNPWDRNFIARLVGHPALGFLDIVGLECDNDPDLMRYALVYMNGMTGILDLPMATKNYLKSLTIPDIYRNHMVNYSWR